MKTLLTNTFTSVRTRALRVAKKQGVAVLSLLTILQMTGVFAAPLAFATALGATNSMNGVTISPDTASAEVNVPIVFDVKFTGDNEVVTVEGTGTTTATTTTQEELTITLTSTSATGKFKEGTAASNSWEDGPATFTTNNKTKKGFSYQDTATGTPTITAKVTSATIAGFEATAVFTITAGEPATGPVISNLTPRSNTVVTVVESSDKLAFSADIANFDDTKHEVAIEVYATGMTANGATGEAKTYPHTSNTITKSGNTFTWAVPYSVLQIWKNGAGTDFAGTFDFEVTVYSVDEGVYAPVTSDSQVGITISEVPPTPGTKLVRNVEDSLTFSTIQEAIDATTTGAGETIEVSDGIYNENVVINKSGLTLRSQNGASSTTIAPASGRAITMTGNTGNLAGITIDGFTLNGTAGQVAVQADSQANDGYDYQNLVYKNLVINAGANGFGLGLFDVNGITIDNVQITGAATGIEAIGVAGLTMSNSSIAGSTNTGFNISTHAGYEINNNLTFTNNTFTGNSTGLKFVNASDVKMSGGTVSGGTFGIMSQGSTTTVDGVAFSDIHPSVNYGYAVVGFGGTMGGTSHFTGGTYGANNLTVKNSTFSNIGRTGTVFSGTSSTGSFTNNTYTGKGDGAWLDYGVDMWYGAKATISNNAISDNLGIASDGSGSSAISVWDDGSVATITGNTFNNNYYGVYGLYGSNSIISQNNITNSQNKGVIVSGATATATENYWGHKSGPGGAGSGSGDAVSTGVTFSPWLCGLAPSTVTTTDGTCQNLDITAPSVPVNGQPHSTHLKTNVFDFTWNASTDETPGDVQYEFRSKLGSVPTDSNNAWTSGILNDPTIHSTGAVDGTWYWQVRAIDVAGNKSDWSEVWNVTLDTVAPAVKLVSPTGFIKADSIDFSGYVNDDNFRHYNTWISTNQTISAFGTTFNIGQEPKDANGSLARPGNTTWPTPATTAGVGTPTSPAVLGSYDISGLPDGSYTIHVNGHDLARNSTIDSIEFTIDRTAPNDVAIAVDRDVNPNEAIISAKDTHLNRIDVSLWKEGQAGYVAFPGEWVSPIGADFNKDYASKLNLATLAEGKYEIRATAGDAAGNSKNAESVFFTIETVSPGGGENELPQNPGGGNNNNYTVGGVGDYVDRGQGGLSSTTGGDGEVAGATDSRDENGNSLPTASGEFALLANQYPQTNPAFWGALAQADVTAGTDMRVNGENPLYEGNDSETENSLFEGSALEEGNGQSDDRAADEGTAKKSTWWPWALLIAIIALGGWYYRRRRMGNSY